MADALSAEEQKQFFDWLDRTYSNDSLTIQAQYAFAKTTDNPFFMYWWQNIYPISHPPEQTEPESSQGLPDKATRMELYSDEIFATDPEGNQYKLWIPVYDIQDLANIKPQDLYKNAQLENITTGEFVNALATFPQQYAQSVNPDQLYATSVYQSLADGLVSQGLPEGQLGLSDIQDYLGQQAFLFTTSGVPLDLPQINEKLATDTQFAKKMRVSGLMGTPSEEDLKTAKAEKPVPPSPPQGPDRNVLYSSEVAKGTKWTGGQDVMVAKTGEEAKQLGGDLGANFVIESEEFNKTYREEKENLTKLRGQGYNIGDDNWIERQARNWAVTKAEEQNKGPWNTGQDELSRQQDMERRLAREEQRKAMAWSELKTKASQRAQRTVKL